MMDPQPQDEERKVLFDQYPAAGSLHNCASQPDLHQKQVAVLDSKISTVEKGYESVDQETDDIPCDQLKSVQTSSQGQIDADDEDEEDEIEDNISNDQQSNSQFASYSQK